MSWLHPLKEREGDREMKRKENRQKRYPGEAEEGRRQQRDEQSNLYMHVLILNDIDRQRESVKERE